MISEELSADILFTTLIHKTNLFHRYCTDYRYLQNTDGPRRQGVVDVTILNLSPFNHDKDHWT